MISESIDINIKFKRDVHTHSFPSSNISSKNMHITNRFKETSCTAKRNEKCALNF